VRLNYFRFVQHRIKYINSGDILCIDEEGCLDKNKEPVLKFSSKQLEEIAKRKSEGYLTKKAVVTFLVYWFDPEIEKESLIVLPEIFYESDSNRSEI
jgi:ATP-dependent DNA helicase RecQ